MWVPKFIRDQSKGIDTPMPSQVISNEEITPPPISKEQSQVEHLTMKWGEENAKKIGMDRRDFMRTSMGMATMAMASNAVWGPHWEVDAQEAFDPAVTEEKYPKGEYFIVDVQAHFTNAYERAIARGQITEENPRGQERATGFRKRQFLADMGIDLKNDPYASSFQNWIKEMYFDSETNMTVISGTPQREFPQRDDDGKVLEGYDRGGSGLSSHNMSRRGRQLNEIAGSQRAVWQSNCAPNHYWNREKNEPDWNALYEQMEREVKVYDSSSWKWYCHTDPGRSGNGFQIDDDNAFAFYDKARELGLKVFSVHKGYRNQSRTLGHLANPKDTEKAALQNPDLTFIIYHSAIMLSPVDPTIEFDPETGEFLWHNVLIDIKKRNPELTNLNVELGSAFNLAAVMNPELCQHLMGRNLKYYGADHIIWGTDCLWWGSPQWCIDLMKRFTIREELIEKHDYPQITKEDKAKIFGLNAARIYNIDAEAKRNAFPADALSAFREKYTADGGQPSNRVDGWVRAEA